MTTHDNDTDPGIRVPRKGRRAVRLAVMCIVAAAIVFLAVTSWSRG